MNRRTFFGTLFGLAIAPTVVAKVSSAPPTPKYKLYRDKHSGLVGYKGKEFMRAGVINAPYIPIAIPDLMSVQPMNMRSGKVFRISYKYDDAAKKIF